MVTSFLKLHSPFAVTFLNFPVAGKFVWRLLLLLLYLVPQDRWNSCWDPPAFAGPEGT